MKRLAFLATVVLIGTFAGLCLAETDHAAMEKIAGLTDRMQTVETNVTSLASATNALNAHGTNKYLIVDDTGNMLLQSGSFYITNSMTGITISFTPVFTGTPVATFTPFMDLGGDTNAHWWVSAISSAAVTMAISATPAATTTNHYQWMAIGLK